MKRVLVFGTFDSLHPGHLYVLHEAQKKGELWVVIARDATVQSIKNRTPEQTEDKRMEAVQAALPDAHVLLGDEKEYGNPLQEIKPDLILLGYDQSLPPGITSKDFSCPVQRLKPYKPEQYKSSLLRKEE